MGKKLKRQLSLSVLYVIYGHKNLSKITDLSNPSVKVNKEKITGYTSFRTNSTNKILKRNHLSYFSVIQKYNITRC